MGEEHLNNIAQQALDDDLYIVADSSHNMAYRNQVVNHLIFFVPGIRDQGNRSDVVAHTLEKNIPAARVVPIKYDGHFGAIRLFLPFSRRRRQKILLDKVIPALSDKNIHKISFIAHSFGTYLLSQAMNEMADVRWHKIILCGSIASRNFDWNKFDFLKSSDICVLNDCGIEDNWPVVAESISNAFSSTGVYGFGSYGVCDRSHPIKHSGYFEEKFIEQYWVDFIDSGLIKKGVDQKPENHFHNLLVKPVFRLKHSIPIVIICGTIFYFF